MKVDHDPLSLPPYRPVSCSLYDVLEAAAVRRTPVRLHLSDSHVDVRIKDVFAKGREEFLTAADLETGSEITIRLDMLASVQDLNSQRTHSSDHC